MNYCFIFKSGLQFKILLRLQPGENILTFDFLGVKVRLSLNVLYIFRGHNSKSFFFNTQMPAVGRKTIKTKRWRFRY